VATQWAYSTQGRSPGETPAPTPWLASRLEVENAGTIAAWNGLAHDVIEPNVFNECWYLLPALQQFDPANAVRLFTLWEGTPGQGRMLGLMPMAAEKLYGRWPIQHVQNWLHPNAFLGTPLVRKGYETAFWQALLTYLDTVHGNAVFFHLNGLTTGGALQQALFGVCEAQSRRSALVHTSERAFLQSEFGPQAYFEDAVRGKKRKELRRQKNRLEETGLVTLCRTDGMAGLEQWTQEFLALERRGWKGANGSALDCADNTRALFCAALSGAAGAGQLERLDLRLDGKPLAMLVNFLAAPGSFSFKTAFDEDYARFSPGVLLQIENLALLERDGIQWCDSCAVQGHPMIDSLWTGRRTIGRYSVAIGGSGRRALFATLLRAELLRGKQRSAKLAALSAKTPSDQRED
jgi:hypothetical protein